MSMKRRWIKYSLSAVMFIIAGGMITTAQEPDTWSQTVCDESFEEDYGICVDAYQVDRAEDVILEEENRFDSEDLIPKEEVLQNTERQEIQEETGCGSLIVESMEMIDTYAMAEEGAAENEEIIVTFDFTGGTGDFPVFIKADAEGNVTIPKTSLTKKDSIFYRWHTDPNGDDRKGRYYFDDYTYTFTESTTLYAIWLEGYQITYNLMGGYFPEEETGPGISYYIAGHRYWLPEPERDGYYFHEWYFDENCDKGSITHIQENFKGDLNLYARWEPIGAPPYLILNANDGSGRVERFDYTANELVTVPDYFTRNGYVLWQWNTMPDGSGNGYGAGFCISNGFGTYYAQWTVPYKITYILNGGINDAENPDSFYNQQVVLKDPIRRGYKFEGWYLYSDFSGSSQWQIPSYTKKDVTLYAKWSRDESTGEECTHDNIECVSESLSQCESDGIKQCKCQDCQEMIYQVIPATGHTPKTAVTENLVNATCANNGSYESVIYCNACNKEISRTGLIINATGNHSYTAGTEMIKATTSADGSLIKTCVCGKTQTTVIPRVLTCALSTSEYTYDGKTKNPELIVKDAAGKLLVNNTDYTVSVPNSRRLVGKYTYEIKFMGKYSGTESVNFVINPEGTSLSRLSALKGGYKAKWKKQAVQTSGYQIQYSTSPEFISAKTMTIGKSKTVSKSINKLSKGKKYYVRIRTYKAVGSTKYYSGWSAVKNVATKRK